MHVAIIMDGNGRWATRRGLPRQAGHLQGAAAVRKIVEAARSHGIEMLTLYAFSAANWARPRAEVINLLRLFKRYLISEAQRCCDNDIRLNVIGRRDRLPAPVLRAIAHAERRTLRCKAMSLRIAVDYSAQQLLIQAAARSSSSQLTSLEFLRSIDAASHASPDSREVDLLIRTGGEQRLSDFLLWECAYAELWFTSTLWPDFDVSDFQEALAEYSRRQRRFGCIHTQAQ